MTFDKPKFQKFAIRLLMLSEQCEKVDDIGFQIEVIPVLESILDGPSHFSDQIQVAFEHGRIRDALGHRRLTLPIIIVDPVPLREGMLQPLGQ